MARAWIRVVAVLMAGWLTACTASPLSVTGRFDSDARLLEMGAEAQFNATDAMAQLRQQVPLIYFYAYEAGVLPLVDNKYPDFSNDLNTQQRALAGVGQSRWLEVAQAGERSIDQICGQYQSALYLLDKNRRTALSNLNFIQSATVGIMGLALAAQKTIGIVGIAFGLAASLFDTTVNSVLYRLPPASVVSVMNAQRDVLRSQEAPGNPNAISITNQIAVGNRLNEYIRYCTPVIIEANVEKLLGQTTVVDGKLSATTEPATGSSLVRQTVSSPKVIQRVFDLQPPEALVVYRAMSAKIAERPAVLQTNLRAMIGPGITTGNQAQRLLKAWIVLDEGTPTFVAEWNDAIDAAHAASPVSLAVAPAQTDKPLVAVQPSVQKSAIPALEKQVMGLSDEDALAVAQVMYPKLSDRSDALQRRMHGFVASEAKLNADNAKLFLTDWINSDDPASQFRVQWTNALAFPTLAHTNPSGSYSATLQAEIRNLKPPAALAVAKIMYPNLQERPPSLQTTLLKLVVVPNIGALTEANAPPLLVRWIGLENRTSAFEAEWVSALASIPH